MEDGAEESGGKMAKTYWAELSLDCDHSEGLKCRRWGLSAWIGGAGVGGLPRESQLWKGWTCSEVKGVQ